MVDFIMKEIYCCKCEGTTSARLTDGKEIYPHRKDLYDLPFWKCDICGNFVGCHHKTTNRTNPLGCIPSPAIKNARQHIHKVLDPLWQSGSFKRKQIYAILSKELGWKYHTANIKTVEEGRKVYRILKRLGTEV